MKTKILLAILIALVLVGGGYFVLRSQGFTLQRPEPVARHEQLDLGEFLVNLKDEHRCYLRTQIVIEYVYEEKIAKAFADQQAKIRDRVIAVLRSKSSGELLEAVDLQDVRNELIAELEAALDLKDTIVDLWFTNFIIQ